MSEKPLKHYLFASDFDQTLTFDDSGYVLSEIVGIPTEEFTRKATGMAKLNLVQQGAELAYLLLHDPEFRARVRKEHLYEVGKRIRPKENIGLLYEILDRGIDGYHFDFYILSAAPVEVIQSALEGVVPTDHIYGTEFRYTSSGEIDAIVRAIAGYGKVAVLDQLQTTLQIGPDHIVYAGDGSSDIHVMLHVNARDGFTIAGIGNRSHRPDCKTNRAGCECTCRACTHLGEDRRLAAPSDPGVLRVVRFSDPRMEQSTNRLAYAPPRRHSVVASR